MMSEILDQPAPALLKHPANTAPLSPDLTTQGLLKTIKRNHSVVPYDENKIRIALTKAFIAVEGMNAAASSRIHEQIDLITQQITQTFIRRLPKGGTVHIEDI